MFCKYCGKPLNGTLCGSCGAETVLKKRSRDLDLLMHGAAGPVSSAAPSAPEPSAPSVSVPESRVPEETRRRIGEVRRNGPEEGIKRTSSSVSRPPRKAGRIAVLFAAAVLLGAAVGGVLFGSLSYRSGFTRGEQQGREAAGKEAEALYGSEIDSSRQEGYDEGRRTGYVSGCAVSGLASAAQIRFPAAEEKQEAVPESAPVREDTPRFPYSQKRDHAKEDPVVRRIQARLAELGYYSDEIDGKYGRNTKAAVTDFQRDAGVRRPTGEVDRETWDLLFPAATPTPSPLPSESGPVSTVPRTPAPDRDSDYRPVSPLNLPPASPYGGFVLPLDPQSFSLD